MSFSLYVHLPFCARKCAYCDFESYAGRLDQVDVYIDRVLSEAQVCSAQYGAEPLKSAYFGGGTPSLLSAEQLKRLSDALLTLFPPEKDAEITVEANPGTLKPDLLKAARDAGINRLSLGVQAKQDRLLKILGRIHSFEEAAQAVELAFAAGFHNISCDVMFALPKQTDEELLETLESVCRFGIQHISCYSLILEEGAPLKKRVLSGELPLPDEETCRRMQLKVVDSLEARGFLRYEISNFALPGFESQHNMVYWTGGEYLGLGCSAHSYMRGERFCNPSFEEYMRGSMHTEGSFITPEERLEEAVLLQTRLTRGIDLNQIARAFGRKTVEKLCENAGKYPDLTEVQPSCLRLTREGLMVQNALVLELLDGINEEEYR